MASGNRGDGAPNQWHDQAKCDRDRCHVTQCEREQKAHQSNRHRADDSAKDDSLFESECDSRGVRDAEARDRAGEQKYAGL